MQSFFLYIKITFFLLTIILLCVLIVSYVLLAKRKKKKKNISAYSDRTTVPSVLFPCFKLPTPLSEIRVGVRPSRDKCVLSSHCCQHGPRSCCDDEFAQHLPEITLLDLLFFASSLGEIYVWGRKRYSYVVTSY